MPIHSFYSSPQYKKLQSRITHNNWKKGLFNHRISPLEIRVCANNQCNKVLRVKPYDLKIYCSNSCAATVNNSKRACRIHKTCLNCNGHVRRSASTYCSLKCQMDHKYRHYIQRWKQGLETGNIGITTKVIASPLRRYLREKFKNHCSKCSWSSQHSITGHVPLEINHIDGNAENNKESNLELLCPNCHSLTPNFRNLNKGNGRAWRLKPKER